MVFPIEYVQNTTISYLPKIKSCSYILYWFLLCGVILALASLPYIYTDISVKTSGITRPISERTEVKPVISGIIETLFYKEGDRIQKDAVILRIKDLNTKGKKILNQFEINQREQFTHDLGIITTVNLSENIISELSSPLYKELVSKFLNQKEEQITLVKKADKEVEMNSSLALEKVISSKEFFDIKINQQKCKYSYKAFLQEQLSNWQQDLARYRLELSQYRQQLQQVNADAAYYDVRAPISGIIQGINTRYPGCLLQANETLCTISPEGNLIGECYVQTRDIGFLKLGQAVNYQVEAFDYNYFGVLTGKILAIDNDYTIINNATAIKVRCSFDSTQLHLKNGFSGQLKKGLNFQARFTVARRSLWQLLFDKLDDWLNPAAPPKNTTAFN